MVTISLGAHAQATGTLVRLEGDMAWINASSRLLYGRLVTPLEELPVTEKPKRGDKCS